MAPAPVAADLAALIGRDIPAGEGEEHANACIAATTAMAKAYCRGAGFRADGPTDELRIVILTSAARLHANTMQLGYGETKGPESLYFREGFTGFTLAERYILDRYRVRAL
ncbi:MAG: hypothetical protein JWR37_4841 [Mycobacterium sp.]|nr:hypothetical protein [Mycobacterium sp.]